MKVIDGGVTAAKGFMAANTAAGIKYTDRDDMAMVVSKAPCVTAGTYTRNVVKAAPVLYDRKITGSETPVRAVVVNAGIANACTGEEGLEYCRRTAGACAEAVMKVADAYGIKDGKGDRAPELSAENVLVASTGVIGMQLPIEKLENGVKAMAIQLSESREAGNKAARAIMTTDTIEKEAAVEFEIGGVTVTLGAMTKGSGMIHPNMGTMLCFNTTDLCIKKELLQEALSDVVKDTYNMITVDGDTSTNDTCVILANGLAKNPMIEEKNADYDIFVEALREVNRALAMKMAGDGEGATALFEAKVKNADSDLHARILAKSVVGSSLVKAMIYGHDANFGRILCALGYAGVDFDPDKVDLFVESAAGRIEMARNGREVGFDEAEAKKIFSEEHVTAVCDMHMGDFDATAWGCDLTHEYVTINADYRS